MAATIYDIAKACHCSTTTVSKVLNNQGKISKEKRDEILETAKKLGYVRSQTARSLASSDKSSKMVGILLHILEDKSITHELFSGILNSFRNEMEKNGYDICFLRNIDEDSDLEYKDFISSRGLDGLFIISASIEKEKTLNLLKEEDIPLVTFDVENSKVEISSNNKESVASLVDYLVKMGHRRIVFVRPRTYGVSKERYEGFLMGLERNHIEFDERMVVEAPFYSSNSAKIATDLALNSDFNPTVIMYPDDYTAISAIKYLRELGKKVPKDISITGFDGIEIASIMHPSLTTIRQDTKQIGYVAASELLKQINKEAINKKRIIISAEVVEGGSIINLNK